jgi:prephenate dehydrogenase
MLTKRKLRVFIVGLGQIGASLGYDLMANPKIAEVIGYDKYPAVSVFARRKRAIGTIARSVIDGIAASDITILATPIRETIKLLPLVCKAATRDKVIIDVAGTKLEILKHLQVLDSEIRYISCHPIAGTEKTGVVSARKRLFKGVPFILVPLNRADDGALRTVTGLIKSVGAVAIMMDAKTHDRLIALTSDLPYVLALSLAELARRQSKTSAAVWDLTGGSLRSAIRVAMSSPELTLDMITTNRTHIAESIDLMIAQLQRVQELIRGEDDMRLKRLIARAQSIAERVHRG